MDSEQENLDSHFKRHVAELGDSLKIVANRDVISASGIKLLSAGSPVDSSMYKHILEHKLLPLWDQALSIENPVTPAALVEWAKKISAEQPLFSRMHSNLPESQSLFDVLGEICLNKVLAFKLTVAREKLPDLYNHAVASALICAYLGFKSNFERTRVVHLATAGLFHDLGELHIDPAILNRNHQLNNAEIRHIYAHPLTLYLMLREFPEYPPEIGNAILEHHERLDGSGYPQGITKIGQMSRLLEVTEVAASLYRIWGENGLGHIETTFKLNMHQMDTQAISHLLAVLRPGADAGTKFRQVDIDKLREALRRMSEYFSCWDQKLAPKLEAFKENKAVVFLSAQVNVLKKDLESAGFYYEQIDKFVESLANDSPEAYELQNLTEEFAWRSRDIMHELQRRWPAIEKDADSLAKLLQDWIKQAEKSGLSSWSCA